MTFEEMAAVVAEAHNYHRKVTGHCRATQGIKNALRAGFDTLEHGTFMDDEALDMLLARNTPVVPALQFELASIEKGPAFGMPQSVIDGHKETLEGGAESARMILKAGGRLGMGGDYGFAWNPHGDYAKELTFFVNHVGFTPLETITCATKTGAEIMGRGARVRHARAGQAGRYPGRRRRRARRHRDPRRPLAVPRRDAGGRDQGGAAGGWGDRRGRVVKLDSRRFRPDDRDRTQGLVLSFHRKQVH